MEDRDLTRVQFGLFEFDLRSGELKKAGHTVKLQSQPAKVLAVLIRQAGQIVTRKELQQAVWGEHYVDFDQGLNYCITQIRYALSDRAEAPIFIETVPRRGYRFIAPVGCLSPSNQQPLAHPLPETEPSNSTRRRLGKRRLAAMLIGIVALITAILFWPSRRPPAPAAHKRLAVLPFSTFNGDPDHDYFSDSLTEEMITTLSRLSPQHLSIIARTSAMRYKGLPKRVAEIGRELEVEYILTGSVQNEQGQLRIQVQLIRTGDESHVWAQSYDRPVDDLLGVQRDVAQAVARSLSVTLLPEALPAESSVLSASAREAYLKARYWLARKSKEGGEKAIAELSLVIAQAPDYAPAHVALALAYLQQNLPMVERLRQIKPVLETALRLDDTSAEAHLVMGYLALMGEWNPQTACQHIERAITLEPGRAEIYHLYATYFSILGQHDEAIRQLQRAKELDPVSPIIVGDMGWLYFAAGRYAEAVEEGLHTLELEPENVGARDCLVHSYRQLNQTAAALEQAQAVMKLWQAPPERIARVAQSGGPEGLRDYWQWSRDYLRVVAAQEYVDPCIFALLEASLDDRDAAFRSLEAALHQRSELLIYLNVEPRYERLRADPRFADLQRRMGDWQIARPTDGKPPANRFRQTG